MCGIYGHYHAAGAADSALVERMAVRLVHRGPDGMGAYRSARGTLAFGAGRLAIIDLNAGVQPIFSEDRQTVVIFNGEIYNYKALRAALESAGHHFATHTDTEVIAHGYEEWGDDVLTHLRGMFALCIYDEPRDRLLIARDRIGEKPLYFTQRGGGELLFASEIKALLEHPGIARAVNADALPLFLTLGYVPPDETLFAGIHKLAPAEYLIVEDGQIRRGLYWQAIMDATDAPSYDDARHSLRALLEETIAAQMMSDVEVGAFLSGGVDSSLVVALMKRTASAPINTFTVGFDFPNDPRNDTKFNVDARYAAQVAQHLGTTHHSIFIREDDALAHTLTGLVYALDEPLAHPAIVQTAYVSALARMRGVPVLLNGEGGDELFLGYAHYRADRWVERYQTIPALMRRGVLNPLIERAPSRFDALRRLAHKAEHADPAARYIDWMRVLDTSQVSSLLHPGAAEHTDVHLAAALRPTMMQPNTRFMADRLAFGGLRLQLAENMNMRVDKMSMAMLPSRRGRRWKIIDWSNSRCACRSATSCVGTNSSASSRTRCAI
ncbi:MAG: asparagine synthase (glutamine-hydrolyzing) [Blastochloris sp.]|nr:asparagine synthase (glutamine-hydrolyzing) [Blastochloris sp.]